MPAPPAAPGCDRDQSMRVDTTTHRPTGMRSNARAGVLERLLVTDPRAATPDGTARITYRSADLERIWTSAARLRPVLVWTGTFTPAERLPLLFAALSAASSTLAPDQRPVLLLCGDQPRNGPTAAHPLALAHTYNIADSVFVAGHRPRSQLPTVYRASDAYITTAASDTSATLWEAMVNGCPPIAVTGTAAKHAILNGGWDANGWTADPEPVYLAAAIAQACIAPAERARRGAAAAAWIHRQ
ncbi:glycosyltransferase [Kitasatospora sp. NPDC057223]|uniref:glycosyltransferase n=1 Tax=Kitasatospora sp. NPDC057223 TaxID=3346055 RepID=UPI0036266700